MSLKQTYDKLASESIEQLLEYSTYKEDALKTKIANHIIARRLSEYEHELQKAANAPATKRANYALLISGGMLLIQAAPHILKHF